MMAKTRMWLSRAISVLVALSTISLGASPASAAALAQADIFSTTVINAIELQIPDASATSLNNQNTAKNYVAATFKFSANGQSIGPINVGIRMKGSTSLSTLDRTPSFKIAFNWKLLKGNRFLGLKNLTLNAMTQDESKLHEFGSYKLFNLMGVPAPRTGWTDLKINGTAKGLYLSVESVDDIFLGTKYKDVTQHLYEGIALNDLKPGYNDGAKETGRYLVKEGWADTPNKNDLGKLISAANYSSGAKWYAKLATVTDRTELLKMFAVENFIGHWDGYTGPLQNNHFFRSNILGKFTIIPWGADQTFGENRQTRVLLDDYFIPLDKPTAGFPWVQQSFKKDTMPRGMLFVKCLAYSVCKKDYLIQLKAVSAKVTSSKFVTAMKSASTVISSRTSQPMKNEQVRVQSWIGKQQTRVASVLKANGIR
jgi:spore coat protein CotH